MEHPEVTFLKNSDISNIITKGLSQVVKAQPEKPIDYLAKWLLNYNEIQKKERSLMQKMDQQQSILAYIDQKKQVEKQKIQNEKEEQQAKELEEQQFLDTIHKDEYLPEQLVRTIPNFLKQRLGVTACYISELEHSKQPIDPEDDSEFAHLDTKGQKNLQYIGASDDHEFLLGETLRQGSVTYKLFEKSDEDDQKQKILYIPDITQQQNLQYFRIPKLGSYMAISVNFEHYLTPECLEKALSNKLTYNKKLAAFNKELENQKKTAKEKLSTLDPESDEAKYITQELQESIENNKPPTLEPLACNQKQYVISIDTMGQDREISNDAQTYLCTFAKRLEEEWEKVSKVVLERDVESYVSYNNSVQPLSTYAVNEELDEVENNKAQLKFYLDQLNTQEFQGYLKLLCQYRVIKFSSIIQGVLYLLGYNREEVNVNTTNVLNWKAVKHVVASKDFMDRVNNYQFEGPKTEEFPDYKKIQRLQKREDQLELIQNYNQFFLVIYQWYYLVLQLRQQDIYKRRQDKVVLREEREALIVQAQERKEKKKNDLAEAQENLATPEEQEAFNQESWEQEWDSQNPEIIIPDEVIEDIDNDIEQTN